MRVNVNNTITISEANQNFYKVARMVDENGSAVILENNTPKYILIDFNKFHSEEITRDESVETIAVRFLAKHRKVFQELAK